VNRLTTEKFITKAIAKHGDRYGYSKVDYVAYNSEVIIISPVHHDFSQVATYHLSGNGCQECGGTKKLTTKTFIEKAKAIHGDRYDYSKVEYVNNSIEVTIICPEHSDFPQRPVKHLIGRGCRKCGGTEKLATAEFVERAKAIHGDCYDYSKVEYVNNTTDVTIICAVHGPVPQSPNSHLQGRGCRYCAGNTPFTTETFIEKAKAVHGDRFDYSKVEYVNNSTPVTIICRDHDDFPQRPANHLRGSIGCNDCKTNTPLTTETFIEKAKRVYGDRFDYSKVEYVRTHDHVKIICPEHGSFDQTPASHLQGYIGCDDCKTNTPLTTEKFIEKAKAVHGDRYVYSQVEYVNIDTPVMIICREHDEFPQIPYNHINLRCGCSDCADYGFNPSEPCTLYYLAITTDDGDTRYKIGVTQHTVEKRYTNTELARIRIVKLWRYGIGRAAAEREMEILRLYAGDRYYGPDILRNGNSELFTHDVLGLDTPEEKDF